MRRWTHIISLAVMLPFIGTAMPAGAGDGDTTGGLTWHRYDKALPLAKKQNRFVLIDFYTDWCGWCDVMDEKTYADPSVKALLEKSFILVKVNAESRRFVKLRGQNVTEVRLASIYRVKSYPTTWFLQPDGKAIAPVNGYVTPEKFERILRYISEGVYHKMGFEQYMNRPD